MLNRLSSLMNWTKNSQGRYLSSFLNWKALDKNARLDLLDEYYNNNTLYEQETQAAYWYNAWLEPLKPYRNPTNRSVEFFASKLCQGTPKISVDNGNILVEECIQKFLKWSNFDGTKRAILRKDALHGNIFIKVCSDGFKVKQDFIEFRYVTACKQDTKGIIQEIRFDIPMQDEKNRAMTHTEYWTVMDGGYVSIWEHYGNSATSLQALNNPIQVNPLSDFGIDFIPIVLTKFKDIGEQWGKSCIEHAIVKIDEINRKHTRMSELLFQYNKPIFGVVNQGRDSSGRPFPIKHITSSNVNQNKSDDNIFMYVEGADIKSLIPDLHWDQVLAILASDEEELERDLPELKYYSIKDTVRSGVALQTLLAGALDRAKEAQENFNTNQERLNEMALTIGKFYGIFPKEIGTYENGDFDHNISFDEIIPIATQNDKATTLAQINPVAELSLEAKLRLAGYTEDEIASALPDTSMPEMNITGTNTDMNTQDMMMTDPMTKNNTVSTMTSKSEMPTQMSSSQMMMSKTLK